MYGDFQVPVPDRIQFGSALSGTTLKLNYRKLLTQCFYLIYRFNLSITLSFTKLLLLWDSFKQLPATVGFDPELAPKKN